MVNLSEFSFSQNNLQDFLECPRRFELRHLHKLSWPAVSSEPVLEMERHMQLGERFHQIVQQHQLGLQPETLETTLAELELARWWGDYLAHPLQGLPSTRIPELFLQTHFEGYRFVAKFDLLAINPDEEAVIVDWKTNRQRPNRIALQTRAQTRLYPFLLVQSGAYLNKSKPVLPEQIRMVYWFTAQPDIPEIFQYSSQQYIEDCHTISEWLAQITHMAEIGFPLTTDIRLCKYCRYRSLCERGIRAGEWAEIEEDESPLLDLNLDFDQIGEIQF